MANSSPAGGTGPVRADAERAGGAGSPMKTHEDVVRITWRWNRSHELRVDHTVIAFSPHGSQVVPLWVIQHAEFKNQADDFVVEEVR